MNAPAISQCARLSLLLLAFSGADIQAAAPIIPNPVLFVTQVPIPDEVNDNAVSNVFVSVVTPLGNHLADTAHAGRGGDLYVAYTNGVVRNLTGAAGYGTSGSQDGAGIAVRDPHVHWSGTKALFSMVVGAPMGPADTTSYLWQLYEITNFLDPAAVPNITKVPNQPGNYNNMMGCYGTDGRIIFACDRPRGGVAHLYPQLDEYNDVPSNSGLWSLDPQTGDLFHMEHSPSGSFHPFVDSFGRVIFTRWDHLVQDRNATDDRIGRANNGTFNYFNEQTTAYSLTNRPVENFPEPRTYDSNQLALLKVQGNAINIFFPWMMNEDGTAQEVLNHVGRHELAQTFRGSSFTNDPNLVQQFNVSGSGRFNGNYLNNFLQIREDPAVGGNYFGVDSPDFGMHGAGQIISLFGPPGTNPDRMVVTYVTPKSTTQPNSFGAYRDPLPMSDGTLLAAYTRATSLDANSGTAANPRSGYNFRLMKLTKSGATWTTNQYVTAGLTNPVTYWHRSTRVTHTNALWELQPVEVRARAIPNSQSAAPADVESQVFAEEGVELQAMQQWLRSNGLALVVSRNVTTRDAADREQPFNLRVAGTATQTLGTNTGKIYDVRYIQFFQADLLRGLTFGGTNPVPGRRVLATPMHDSSAINANFPNMTGPAGSTRIGDDGSQATFLPARRAMTHQLTDTNGNYVVRERYWITYQPGEIRTCTSCHGINTKDQAGQPKPTNKPQALRELLRYWKAQTGYLRIAGIGPMNSLVRINISAAPNQTNVIETSSDLAAWRAIATNLTGSNGLHSFEDSKTNAVRFYRVKKP